MTRGVWYGQNSPSPVYPFRLGPVPAPSHATV